MATSMAANLLWAYVARGRRMIAPEAPAADVRVGTAAYMAPEQARGKAVDRRADIWAFGVVLFEMLAGERLFTGDTATDTLASVLKSDVLWNALPAATPQRLRELLRRCIEKDPRRRLQAVGDARAQLEEMIAGASGDEPRLAAPGSARASSSSRTLPWAVTAVLAVGLVVAVWAYLMARTPRSLQPPVQFTVPWSPTGDRLAFHSTRMRQSL